MALTNQQFVASQRLQNAAENAPAMYRGDNDTEAVRLIQQALIGVGASSMRRSINADGTLDGDYGSETFDAVVRFQENNGLMNRRGKGDGIIGRNTMAKLDQMAPWPVRAITVGGTGSTTPRAETPNTVNTNNGTVSPPSGDALRAEYNRFVASNGKPCNPTWTTINNQCAIRMSTALGRCVDGFRLDSPNLIVHSGAKCGMDTPHDASSSRLIVHLKNLWTFQHFRKSSSQTADDIHALVRGRKGILYWENCFSSSDPSVGGDHIDYWDGSMMMNDRLGFNARNEAKPEGFEGANRFFHSMERQCWFLALT